MSEVIRRVCEDGAGGHLAWGTDYEHERHRAHELLAIPQRPTMIIGVMSDTHGNRRLMHQAADWMKARHRVEIIVHVGDDYPDAEELAMAGHTVRMVPGLWCDAYHDGRVPNRIVIACDGIAIAAAHAEKDLGARELAASIVLTGHTHVAAIEKLGRAVHVNPGHLKHAKLDRGQRPSYAIIETGPEDVSIRIHELDGAVRMSASYPREQLASID